MKKLLSLLSVLTISGTSLSTTISASNYKKENQNKKTANEIINIGETKYKKEKIEFNLGKKNKTINNIFFDEKNTPCVVVQIIDENKNINEVEVFNLWTKQKEIDDLDKIEEFVAKSNHNFKLKNNSFWKDDKKIKDFIIFLKHNKNYVYFCDIQKDIFKYKIQEQEAEKIYTNTNPDWELVDFVVDNNNENLYFINEYEKTINIYSLLNHNTVKKTLDYIPLSLAVDDDNNIYCVGKRGFNILKQNNILNININEKNNKKIVLDNNNDIYTINLKNEIIKMTKINSDLKLSNNNDFFKKKWIYFATIIPITLIIFTSTIFLFLYIKKCNKIKHKLINNTCFCKICNKN